MRKKKNKGKMNKRLFIDKVITPYLNKRKRIGYSEPTIKLKEKIFFKCEVYERGGWHWLFAVSIEGLYLLIEEPKVVAGAWRRDK